jgi:hypothetical protein
MCEEVPFCDPLILTRSLTATSQSSTIFPALELKMGKQDKRASEAAKNFVACSKNTTTKILLPVAMQAKGYGDVESNNKTLWQ